MDWIKVLNRHILLEYNDLKDSEFVGWIKIMALCAYLEHQPSREQMLKEIHYKTLDSLEKKLNTHSTTLQEVFNKVLIDVQEVVNLRKHWRENTKRYRSKRAGVINDVTMMSSTREDKIRLDNNPPIIPPSGGQEDKNPPKRKKVKKEENFTLPSWIPQETWDAYLAVRAKKKAAQTTYAYNLIIKNLELFRNKFGHDPIVVLNKSIVNGWTDVYPLKEGGNGTGKQTTYTNRQDYRSQREREVDEEAERINKEYYARKEQNSPSSGNSTS